jgi:acyl dehydratase
VTVVSLPDLVVPLDVPQLMAYGASTWDWHRIHYDTDAARAAGMAGALVDGQMFGALIARQIRKWAGPRARFVELKFRNSGFVTAPNIVTIVSKILSSRMEGTLERFEIASHIHDQNNRIVVESGFTVIEVPR